MKHRTSSIVHQTFYYFPIIPSTLILPGPQNKIVMAAVRNKVPVSAFPKISPWLASKTTTHIPMIIGMQANRVNSPRTKNSPQKNSAKIIKIREAVEPMPAKFVKTFCKWSKRTSLEYPWLINNIPAIILKINMPKLKAPVEYFVERNLVIVFFTIVLTKICAI